MTWILLIISIKKSMAICLMMKLPDMVKILLDCILKIQCLDKTVINHLLIQN